MEVMQINTEKSIFQANAITSGRYDFTSCQLDILFMLLAMLDKNDTPGKLYSIWVKDIEAITGRQWQYNQLKEATEDMGSRMFSIETDKSYKQLWFFQHVEYQKGKGYFDVKISDSIRPYLFDLKDNFTVMQLQSALSCSSKYAKRLYALACQWRTRGILSIPIGELKEMLFLKDPKGKEKEQFPGISEFRKNVLEIAKRQINEHTDIEFDYEIINGKRPHIKKGYDTVKLFIGRKKNQQIVIDFNEPLNIQKEAAQLAQIMSYGIGEVVAKRIIKSNKMDVFRDVVEGVKDKLKQAKGTIKDPTAYLIGALKKQGINVSDD
ncbi:MAG: RepB family plasmid replication initiator protein [Flavobacterium sp.]|nr:MAG: RepB family plasmid replication initiator protein [Flavobacterium sp.]